MHLTFSSVAMAWRSHDVVAAVLVCEAVILGLCGFDGGVRSAFGVDDYHDLGASRSGPLWPFFFAAGCGGFGVLPRFWVVTMFSPQLCNDVVLEIGCFHLGCVLRVSGNRQG